jgi:RecG-like helicase
MTLLKFTAFDESGTCEITFYNQNYLADKFPLGATFRFYGQVEKVGKRYKMNSPSYEMVIDGETLKPLVPVYPLTEGISKNRIAADIESAMGIISPELEDY